MKKITKNELINSRFVTIHNNVISYNIPDKKTLTYRDLCLCVAIEALKFRNIDSAIKNANIWLCQGDDGELRNLCNR